MFPSRSQLARVLAVAGALVVSSVAVALSVRAGDETLILANGDRYTGESLGLIGDELRWLTPYGDEWHIPLASIERLETEILVPSAPPPEPAPAAEPSDAAVDAVHADQPPVPWTAYVPMYTYVDRGYDWVSETATLWIKRISIGGQFVNGNSTTNALNTQAEFERADSKYLRQFDAGGTYAEANDKTTANRWWVNGNIDYPMKDKWVWFTTVKNEYNRLTSLDYRGTLSTGLGYRFLNEKVKRLIVRVGPGVTTEIYRDPWLYRITPDLFGEVEFRWPVFTRAVVETKTRAHPSVEDFELVRIDSNSSLIVDLDEASRWKFRIGFRYEYNSVPAKGRSPNEYLTTVSLVYQRK